MISIEAYRACIGSFAFTAQRNVKSISKSISIGSRLSKNAFSQFLRPVRFIALFTLLVFAIPKSFQMIEIQTPLDFLHFSKNGMFSQYPNGGLNLPEQLLITFKVNYFHQGNSKFGETAGIQCSSNCFLSSSPPPLAKKNQNAASNVNSRAVGPT